MVEAAQTQHPSSQPRSAGPEAHLDGFLIQPMVLSPGAVELRVGLVEDPVFGALVAFGQGGASVDIQHDRSLDPPPLNSLLARRLIARTRVSRLPRVYRGQGLQTSRPS